MAEKEMNREITFKNVAGCSKEGFSIGYWFIAGNTRGFGLHYGGHGVIVLSKEQAKEVAKFILKGIKNESTKI